MVERAIKHPPTSFNMQHTRAMLVTGEMKNKLWDAIREIETKDEKPDLAKTTAEKLEGVFKEGYGTVLFFSDQSIIGHWSNQMPIYAEAFKVFDAQATGMLHFSVWAALELEGHGANLQHIAEGAPAIQEGIRKAWAPGNLAQHRAAQFRCSCRPGERKTVRADRGEGQGGHHLGLNARMWVDTDEERYLGDR